MITGPCGKITVEHDHLFNPHHDWMIQVWAGTLLNMTILEVNILSDNIRCKSNFFSLSEADDSEAREITRLCGQTDVKIYYSTKNVVKVTLAVVLLQSHTSRLIDFQYKVITNSTLHDLKFLPAQFIKEMHGMPYNIHTLHFISYKNISIFFYNTYVFLRFVVELSNKTSGCDALIYDGPSSRSPLLTDPINNQSNRQYISTLSCISVHFRHIATLLTDLQCINIYLKKESIPTGHMRIDSNQIIRVSLGSHQHNTYKKLAFSSPHNTFVNIQFESFHFIGNTEAGCYFGGIVFIVLHPRKRNAYGPLCGQYGLSHLRDKGLTFSSHTVYVFIFLYANSGQMSFVMNVASNQCEGIINPCEIPTGTYKRRHHTLIRKQGDKNHIFIKMNDTSEKTCLHIQHIFDDNIRSKTCIIRMSNTNQEADLYVKAELIHTDAPSSICTKCSNIICTSIYQVHTIFIPNDMPLSTMESHEMSFPNNSQPYSHSAKQFIFHIWMDSKYASSIDGSFLLSVKTHKSSCFINHIDTNPMEEVHMHEISDLCSHTTLNTYGSSVQSFKFDLNPGYQLFLQLQLGITKSCWNYSHTIFIQQKYVPGYQLDLGLRLVLRTKHIEWTIESWSSKRMLILFIVHHVPNSVIEEAIHRKDDEHLAYQCQDKISLILNHKEDVLQGTKVLAAREKSSDHYCIHSGCTTCTIKHPHHGRKLLVCALYEGSICSPLVQTSRLKL